MKASCVVRIVFDILLIFDMYKFKTKENARKDTEGLKILIKSVKKEELKLAV